MENLQCSLSASDQLDEFNIEECDVYDILSSLNPSKTMGIDSIGPKVLKYCAWALCYPVTLLSNRC